MIFIKDKLHDFLKLAVIAIVVVGATNSSFAQVKIGNNPGVIDPVSILEMESDSLVMVLPRMTTGDRTAIANPYPGAMIYNTTLSCIEANVGSKATPDWQCLADEDDINSTGHNISFEINSAEDSIKITDAGGTLSILVSDLVSALNTDGGVVADSAKVVDWNNISNMPSDMQNNDQYITPSSSYNNSTDSLDVVISNGGTDFSIDLSDLATDDDVTSEISDTANILRGLINASTAADLDTDPTNEQNTSFAINGSSDSLSITDSGGTKSVDLGDLVTAMDDDGLATDTELAASDAADLDMDPTNEHNTAFEINGTGDSILVTDSGSTLAIDLGDLVSAMDDDGLATDAQLVDTASAIRLYIDTQVAASSGTDLDQVTGNEYNTDMSISGTGTDDSITVTDPGGVEGIDLGDLVTAMDDDGLATDTDVTTEIGDTSAILRGLINASTAADLDTDPTNEQNTAFTINGTGDSLNVTDSGGTIGVDLGDLVTAMDDDGLATDAELAASDAADLDMDPTNEHNTGFLINGAGDSISVVDGGSTQSVDLGDLVTAMDDDGLATDTDVTAEIGDTSAVLRGLINASTAADLDTDPTNEENTSFAINGAGDSLVITDSGGSKSVDLGDLVSAMDDDGLATDAELTASDSADGDKDATNEYNTGFAINANEDSLTITDGGGTLAIGLDSLVEVMDDHGLATDGELQDTAAAIRMYVDVSEDHLGIFDQTLIANREIISAGFDLRMTGTGRMGIGDIAIPTNSKLFVDGLISSSSDRRLKTDIVDLKYGLDEILAVNAVAYTWKDPAKSKMEGTQLGFIAQEVNEIMPELVRGKETETTYLSMTYDRFAPVLVNAIKELKAELDAVKAELAKANKLNASLKSENKTNEDKYAHLMSELDQIKAVLGLNKTTVDKAVGED